MPSSPCSLTSRLPRVGTTVFTVMSRLATEHKALNLAQGFPDFSAPGQLFDLVNKHMHAGANQYAPMAGVMSLREAIAAKVEALYGTRYHPEQEVTITAGGTQAIFTAIACIVRPGDEAIVFEPAYDSYVPAIELNGGVARRALLSFPDFRPNWNQVRELINSRTRLIIINTPHNPTGSVWSAEDMRALAQAVRNTNVVVLADEVYEHIVFDGQRHHSCAGIPQLAERTFIVSSFGKTFHVTGWKVGYVLAPRELTEEFRKVHQFVVFTVHTPTQLALAEYLRDSSRYLELGAFYQRKRNLFRAGLANSRFRLLDCAGTYFQLASYQAISDEPDTRLAERLTREIKVASIPVSAFYENADQHQVLRFCFAKNEDTLTRACERLSRI